MTKDSPLELCTSTAALGNTIAVHILEYMNLVKVPPHGFKDVAVELLELGRVLLATKSGLQAATRPRAPRLTDAQEISDRIRQSNITLVLLDQVVNKLLHNEGKRGISKLGKGLRMMFSDTDLVKLRTSMVLARETLKLSATSHKWAISNDGSQAALGIGYTALAAVLGYEDPLQADYPTLHALVEKQNSLNRAPSSVHGPPQTPPARLASLTTNSTHNDAPPVLPDLPATSGISLHERRDYTQPAHNSTSSKSTEASNPFSSPTRGSNHDNASEITRMSSIAFKEDGNRFATFDDAPMPKQAVRVSADPTTVARLLPQNQTGPVTAASEMALVSAVSQKNYRMVEQLLDRGVAPDHNPQISLIKEAVVNHDMTTLRYLLLYGADPNAADKDGHTALYAATELSFIEAAQLLIDYGADPNISAGPKQDNPLSIAMTDGKTQFAQLYLKYCADTDRVMGNGHTPLTRAINETVSADMIELLLLYGADTNRKDRRGESALFKAINAGRADLVSTLLAHGADPNLPAPKHMLWPAVHDIAILEILLQKGANLKRAPGVLELATSINSFDAVQLLLKYGADPNAKKDGIFTPLCTAIRDDRETLVDMLIAAGADPNLPASEYPSFKCVTHHRAHLLPRILLAGANPSVPKGIVETAVAHNDKDALLVLMKHKVDPNARGASGETALTRAIRNNNIPFIDLLLSHHADPAVRGQEWPIAMAVKNPVILAKLLPHIPTSKILKGALEMAVVAGQLESVKLLLAKGINVEEKNGGVFSPLTTSIREDRKEIFRYLIDEAGANPNSPGEHLPIIKAIRRHRDNDLSYIEHLMHKGADINLMYRGWNAVLQAVDNGDIKILKLLADYGKPDLSARDENGQSVLEIIEERGLKEEGRILLHARTPSPEIADATARLSDFVLRH